MGLNCMMVLEGLYQLLQHYGKQKVFNDLALCDVAIVRA